MLVGTDDENWWWKIRFDRALNGGREVGVMLTEQLGWSCGSFVNGVTFFMFLATSLAFSLEYLAGIYCLFP